MNQESFSLGDDVLSFSSVVLSSHSICSSNDYEYSYIYSSGVSDDSSLNSCLLGATPTMGIQRKQPSTILSASFSPVKGGEDNATLDIDGPTDWSIDISRMSLPHTAFVPTSSNAAENEAIAQDAITTTRPSATSQSEINDDSLDADIVDTLSAQLELLKLRLTSLEKEIYHSNSNNDMDMHVSNAQNVAFIADDDEEESTVASLTNVIVLSDHDDLVDTKRHSHRKLSYFLRLFFLGGCRMR